MLCGMDGTNQISMLDGTGNISGGRAGVMQHTLVIATNGDLSGLDLMDGADVVDRKQ